MPMIQGPWTLPKTSPKVFALSVIVILHWAVKCQRGIVLLHFVFVSAKMEWDTA